MSCKWRSAQARLCLSSKATLFGAAGWRLGPAVADDNTGEVDVVGLMTAYF